MLGAQTVLHLLHSSPGAADLQWLQRWQLHRTCNQLCQEAYFALLLTSLAAAPRDAFGWSWAVYHSYHGTEMHSHVLHPPRKLQSAHSKAPRCLLVKALLLAWAKRAEAAAGETAQGLRGPLQRVESKVPAGMYRKLY